MFGSKVMFKKPLQMVSWVNSLVFLFLGYFLSSFPTTLEGPVSPRDNMLNYRIRNLLFHYIFHVI